MPSDLPLGPGSLTDRHREVLALLERGLTNFEIASELGISLEGAKYHVREIMTRLDVDSREAAVREWRRQRRPDVRIRRALAGLITPKAAGWVAAGTIAVGTAVVVFALVQNDDSRSPSAGETATTTPAATSPIPPTPALAGTNTATGASTWFEGELNGVRILPMGDSNAPSARQTCPPAGFSLVVEDQIQEVVRSESPVQIDPADLPGSLTWAPGAYDTDNHVYLCGGVPSMSSWRFSVAPDPPLIIGDNGSLLISRSPRDYIVASATAQQWRAIDIGISHGVIADQSIPAIGATQCQGGFIDAKTGIATYVLATNASVAYCEMVLRALAE